MTPCILFSNKKRTEATGEFLTAYVKLMNNAVFGKTCGNLKNRMELKLSTDSEKVVQLFRANVLSAADQRKLEALLREAKQVPTKFRPPPPPAKWLPSGSPSASPTSRPAPPQARAACTTRR